MSSQASLCGCQTYFLMEEILKTLRGAPQTSLEHLPVATPQQVREGGPGQ